MIAALLAAAYTFTATATGVEKGTPLEFVFAGKDTDRDYETMFLLDDSISAFCKGLEAAGLPKGTPVDESRCCLWPVGCKLSVEPPLADFVDTAMPEGLPLGAPVYTGGTRNADGTCEADSTMPLAAWCLYTIGQAPIVFDGVYPQGQVYNCHKAKVMLKKGEKRTFTLKWDSSSLPRHVELLVLPGKSAELLRQLQQQAQANDSLDVLVDFDDSLTVSEATAFASALEVIDSTKIRINGRKPERLFYRSFLPLVKWKDRKERLTQPFEISLDENDAKIIYIEEDWSGESLDPVLTEKPIVERQLSQYPKTDTAFFYVKKSLKLGSICNMLRKLPKTVKYHYVYGE